MSVDEPVSPWGTLVLEDSPPGTPTRIVDAAMARFAEHGVGATTMSQLAVDVGISRVSLYRYFANRDAVVVALLGREAKRFLDELTQLIDPVAPIAESAVAAVEFSIVALRGHKLLQRVLGAEPEVAAPFVTGGIGPLLRTASNLIASFLQAGASMDRDEARFVSDALIRLVLSIVVNNETDVDFDDAVQRQAYIDVIVPRLLISPPP